MTSHYLHKCHVLWNDRVVPVFEYMAAANVTANAIIRSSVSRDLFTDTIKTPEELDVIIVVLWSGWVGKPLLPIALGVMVTGSMGF